ncbi:selenide, water dikinase SelD [bacterium]|nr:selenide, water dikinase SelD [bacterium]
MQDDDFKLTSLSHGAGCACKLAPLQLSQILKQMPLVSDPNVLVDVGTSDDAAVYKISDDIAAVLTLDFFTPIVDDPYEFGRIAATNAISDIYAMGGRPVVALNIVAYPGRTRALDKLELILKGGADQATKAGVSIVGGHSVDDPEPKYGLCVMGLIHPNEIMTNKGAKAGDKLILTKPIGVGIITTAIKHNAVSDEVIARGIDVMTTFNGPASEVARRIGCHACTDVTGFSLLGHLHEMTEASCVGAKLYYSKMPLIEGIQGLLDEDMVPGGTYRNLDFLDHCSCLEWGNNIDERKQLTLADPQTSGGLLISVSPDKADDMLGALHAADVSDAAIIGEIIPDSGCKIHIVE